MSDTTESEYIERGIAASSVAMDPADIDLQEFAPERRAQFREQAKTFLAARDASDEWRLTQAKPASTFANDVEAWVAMGRDKVVRAVPVSELFHPSQATSTSQYAAIAAEFDRATAQLPRDHPSTERESAVKQAAMAEHGVDKLTRANTAWADRMARNPAVTVPQHTGRTR